MIKLTIKFTDTDLIKNVSQKNIILNIRESGKDGRTPVAGVDYFTEEDKREFAGMLGEIQVESISEKEINLLF